MTLISPTLDWSGFKLADVVIEAPVNQPRVQRLDQGDTRRTVEVSMVYRVPAGLGAGASAVLSKPLLVDDLFWQIDRLTDRMTG